MNITEEISALEAAQARCDAQEAWICAQLEKIRLGDSPREIRNEADFMEALTGEFERCAQIEDRIGLLTLTFDENLSPDARRVMVGDVCELARQGDLIGPLDDDTLAVAIPWTEPADTLGIARAVEQIAQRHGTPHVRCATVAPHTRGGGVAELLGALEPLSPARLAPLLGRSRRA